MLLIESNIHICIVTMQGSEIIFVFFHFETECNANLDIFDKKLIVSRESTIKNLLTEIGEITEDLSDRHSVNFVRQNVVNITDN